MVIKRGTLNALHWRSKPLVLALLLLSLKSLVFAFHATSIPAMLARPARHSHNNYPTTLYNGQDNKEDEKDIDDFLDKPFFDPDQVTEDDPMPIRWFADLVKNDYATAEVLYSGVLFVVLVIISQELLRMQLYGDGYVPFQAGVRPGQLF